MGVFISILLPTLFWKVLSNSPLVSSQSLLYLMGVEKGLLQEENENYDFLLVFAKNPVICFLT